MTLYSRLESGGYLILNLKDLDGNELDKRLNKFNKVDDVNGVSLWEKK